MRIGRIIHRWRWIEGKSQTAIAKEIGVSKATMSRLERGKQIDAASLMKVMNWITADAPNPVVRGGGEADVPLHHVVGQGNQT